MTSTAAPAIPKLDTYGVIRSDTSGLADVHHLVGGAGTARWKTLINGMHLPGGGWKIIEYVELPPGSGCGRHLHAACEEIYFIVKGQAVMTVNDLEEFPVAAGDLITCPLGTIHGIRVPGSSLEPADPALPVAGPMAFFVVEVFPGSEPPAGHEVLHMPDRLESCPGYRGGGEVEVATVNLARKLGGLWRRFSVIEIPGGGTLGPYSPPLNVSEVLFVTAGDAQVTVDGVHEKGQAGLCVGVPLRAEVMIRNLAGDQPLTLISTEVAKLWTTA